ncbi:MAG TPA: uroporphyrinogen decarboxylase family protein [Planctomycetota bacterium]|nr:uroporphyrinogen decarboxylase family protein [Planctomycetota bacterium]
MAEMTSRERMLRMYEHREADRVPVTDSIWGSTVERWRREGLPEGVSPHDYFGLDRIVAIGADISPRYPEKVLEETPAYKVHTTKYGVTMKNWTHAGGVPEYLDFTVVDADSWARAKARMKPDRDRIDWDRLKENYPKWRESGAWVNAGFWFGFDVTHSFIVGTERTLIAMATDPEWVVDIFNHMLDMDIALFQMAWDAGYQFDGIGWYEDMGYKLNQFFSLDMYRELVKPVQKRACDWAHAKGLKVWLHSCGDIRPFVPELIGIGVNMLNPVEVKAGMDPLALKKQYGRELAFHGGLNAALFDRPELLWEQMRATIPAMKAGGGYVASSDHSVPELVSFETFREFVRLAKELGSYR